MMVEWLELGGLLKSVNSGLNPRNNFVLNEDGACNFYVTVKEITTGKIRFNDKTDKVTDAALKIIQNRSNLEMGDVLVSGIGTIGKVAIVDIPCDNWNCSESVLLLKVKKEKILPKYLMYILSGERVQRIWEKESVGSTLKGIRKAALVKMRVPVPSICEQELIANKLDAFTCLIEKLNEEIELREKQFVYYRDIMLDPERKGVNVVSWGDVCEMVKGNGVQKVDFIDNGKGCIHYGQIYTHYGFFTYTTNKFVSDEIFDKAKKASTGDLIMTDTSENVEDICKTVAYLGEEDVAVSNHALIIKHKQNPKFLSYSTQTNSFFNQKRKVVVGVKVSGIKPEHLSQFKIYLPSIKDQESIVSKLDAFTNLISKLKEERDLRQKQYEYYREKLLTFE